MKSYTSDDLKEIEKAIVFMIDCFSKCCKNEKPVILHSIEVGMKVMNMSKPIEIVQAGIIHDLLEDSDCKENEIEEKFGKRVKELVLALTFDETIVDYKKRWQEAIQRIVNAGTDAMTIKIVDNLQNLPYFVKVYDKKRKKELIWKYKLTIDSFEHYLKDDKSFEEYKKAVSVIGNCE